MKTLTRESPAKINLTLRVTGVRPDGFHDIESLVARVDLSDTVQAREHEQGCYSLECDDPTLPADGSNLMLQAARALAGAADVQHGVDLTLTKRIPTGAGLGGGSSNAATTLSLLNELWQLGRSPAELAEIGKHLGSDVPLFLHGPLCVLRGRGEHVEELDRPLTAWATLILPDLHCATPAVYAAWDRLKTRPQRPALDEVLAALGSVPQLMGLLFNDLEEAAFEVVPELRQLARRVTQIAAGPVRLTGSGSGLYRLFSDEQTAGRFAAEVGNEIGVRTVVAKLLTP